MIRNCPAVSIVIPTHNRQELLTRNLEQFNLQTCPSELFEVIVVTDGCTDGTVEYLKEWDTSFSLNILESAGTRACSRTKPGR